MFRSIKKGIFILTVLLLSKGMVAGIDEIDSVRAAETKAVTKKEAETKDVIEKEEETENITKRKAETEDVAEEETETESETEELLVLSTYAGGYEHGNVYITMTFGDNHKIIELKIDDASSQTPEIGQVAAREMAYRIVEAQSEDVDDVTGATFTCEAVRNAALELIKKEWYTVR